MKPVWTQNSVEQERGKVVTERLLEALNAHDLEDQLGLFAQHRHRCRGGMGEWIWRGTKEEGAPLEERGVTIMSIRNGRIARGRLYLEETEREGADISETVRRMAGWEEA
jgi:hypothetical protein